MTKNVSSLSKSGDVFAEQEDQIADQISELKQRYGNYKLELMFLIYKKIIENRNFNSVFLDAVKMK